jgi:XRE family aerobic/anaerobic benzoate catabolism transcriptional regulator
LRGAGKSTLGRMLAQHLGWPFIELDRIVEEDYGASIPDLIEWPAPPRSAATSAARSIA